MKRRLLALLVPATALVALTAGPAQAGDRCYTPHVGPYPTLEYCHYLPDLPPST